MKIGWFVGFQDWVFKDLAEHLAVELKNDIHNFNKEGDVNIFMTVDQLHKKRLIRKYKRKYKRK